MGTSFLRNRSGILVTCTELRDVRFQAITKQLQEKSAYQRHFYLLRNGQNIFLTSVLLTHQQQHMRRIEIQHDTLAYIGGLYRVTLQLCTLAMYTLYFRTTTEQVRVRSLSAANIRKFYVTAQLRDNIYWHEAAQHFRQSRRRRMTKLKRIRAREKKIISGVTFQT
jgi:hypothetical protein